MASVWIEDRPSVKGRKRSLVCWKSSKLKSMGAADWRGSIICYSAPEAAQIQAEKRIELRRRELGLEPATKTKTEALISFSEEYLRYCEKELARNTVKNFIRPMLRSLLK